LIKYNAILLASVLLLGSFGFGQTAQAGLNDTTAVPQTPPNPSGFDLLIENPDGIVTIGFTPLPTPDPLINFPVLPLSDCFNTVVTSVIISIPPLPGVETLQVNVGDCTFAFPQPTFTFLIDEPTGGEEIPTLKITKITNGDFNDIFSFTIDNGLTTFATINTATNPMSLPIPIPPGVPITVDELPLPTGWSQSNLECFLLGGTEPVPILHPFTALPGQQIECIFTNEFTPPEDPTTGTISGIKFDDQNNNGAIDSGEPGVPDIPIEIVSLSLVGLSSITVNTDSNGIFQFLELAPGDYAVFESPLSPGTINTTPLFQVATVIADQTTIVDIGNRQVIPLPGDMDIPSSSGDVDGVPAQTTRTDLVINKDITTCNPASPPMVTLTWPDGTIRTSAMTLVGVPTPTTWQATFAQPFPPGTATMRVDIDCSPDPPIIQLGDIIFIDPSGTVFDVCTGDPLDGATVTLLKDSGTSFVIPSPSVHIPTTNPQTTLSDGIYHWDVIPGDYKVKVTKTGFVPTTSSTLTIPPPVFDLDFALERDGGCPEPPTGSKLEQKLGVVDTLEDLKTGDKKTDKKIDKAIKHITKSIGTKFWAIDGNSLDDKKSKKVFDEEKKAVKELMKILKKGGSGIDTEISEQIAILVGIDRMLADDAIKKAQTLLDDSGLDDKKKDKVQKEIDKAKKDLEKGDKEFIEKDKPDKAIEKFKKAWEHAQHALKKL